MKTRRKLLVASLGVAAVAYGCRREQPAVGNLMPAPTDDASIAPPGNLMAPPVTPPDAGQRDR
jgi:hypothetical protein